MRSGPYIQQGKDTSCKLVALLNAFIYTFNETPIKYKSREYKMLVEIGRGVAGPIISMREIFTLLGVYTLEPPPACDLQGWVDSRIRAKQTVVFPIISPHVNGHVLLIVGTSTFATPSVMAKHGRWTLDRPLTYYCANAQFHYEDGRTEQLEWRELAAYQMSSSTEGPYAILWHNSFDMAQLVQKKPERIQQAVREYYHALKLTGYFPKPVKLKGKSKKNDQGRRR